MIKLDFSETIKAPVERVFEYATDPDTAAEWQNGVIESRKTPGGQTHQGTTMRTVRVLMGQRLESTAEITEYVPNQKYALKTTGGPVQYNLRQTFTPDGDNTRLETHVEMEPGEAMEVAEPVVARNLREQMENDTKKLKDILES
jgi:uncharacterized protein YndB with AHSA1/START domain